jgi:hypothetical protein
MEAEQAASRSRHDRQRLEEALRQLAAAAGLAAERDRLAGAAEQFALLKPKYLQRSAALKEVSEAWSVGLVGLAAELVGCSVVA